MLFFFTEYTKQRISLKSKSNFSLRDLQPTIGPAGRQQITSRPTSRELFQPTAHAADMNGVKDFFFSPEENE